MTMAKLVPYSGDEKYIFISYAHKDSALVMPIIERLMREGYRVWFDKGIDPGTEWDETIALHVNECAYFVAFMSKNYLSSSNCKDELNYARDLEKDRLLVYLEEVQLPPGLAMRVNRLQSIFKYTYEDQEEFYAMLFSANNIEFCLGEPTSDAQDDDDDDEPLDGETPEPAPKTEEPAPKTEEPAPKMEEPSPHKEEPAPKTEDPFENAPESQVTDENQKQKDDSFFTFILWAVAVVLFIIGGSRETVDIEAVCWIAGSVLCTWLGTDSFQGKPLLNLLSKLLFWGALCSLGVAILLACTGG